LLGLVLLIVSLALATVYLREAEGGALHEAQRAGSAVLDPLTVAGERVARPFRDAYTYVNDLADAEVENEALRTEIAELRREILRNQTAVQDRDRLEEILDYVQGPVFPASYGSIVTRVVQVPSSPFRQEVVIAAGSNDGVERDSPVVSPGGDLVGRVIEVGPSSAKVGLLSDPRIVVSATAVSVGDGPPANGVVKAGASPSAGLVFDRVSKAVEVRVGEPVVTAGWRVAGLESLFPPDIRIGAVRSASQQDIDLYQRIQIAPAVDFESLQDVIVLTEGR
jgi:rod shape-determining protein MreC